MSFSFSHPDPDKLWRLIRRWATGVAWSESEVQEFRLLVKEWYIFYMELENYEQARKLKKKWAQIMKELKNRTCIKKTTRGDVRFVSKKFVAPPETCL